MKKLLLLLVFMGLVYGLAQAVMIGVPETQHGDSLQNDDYGGAQYISTSAFSSRASTITIPIGYDKIVIHGVNFSSGAGGDFVDFFSSGAWLPSMQSLWRTYNSSGGVQGDATTGNTHWYQTPLTFGATVFWVPSSALYNIISVPYTLK